VAAVSSRWWAWLCSISTKKPQFKTLSADRTKHLDFHQKNA
jgi:hypothetical protein